MPSDDLLRRYAELTVRVGANVQRGQDLMISCFYEHAPFARELTAVAYEAGARYVDANYADQHLRREFLVHAPDDLLDWTPPWILTRLEYLAERHGASIGITGDPNPELFADLDGVRVGRARPKELMERFLELIDKHRFDALRFRGPGTDLTVGLLPGSRWIGGGSSTADGIEYVANIPTEEVFTTPDPARTEGRVRSTRPLAIVSGIVVEGLELEFAAGRVTAVRASKV